MVNILLTGNQITKEDHGASSGVQATGFGADFTQFTDLETVSEGSNALLTLDLVLDNLESVLTKVGKLGVVVPGDTDYETLRDLTDHCSLIMINFPVFSDGRGFSLAVRLRKDLGYTGEIRASGHFLPDQALFLRRSGFNSAEVDQSFIPDFEKALERFPAFYQSTVNGDLSLAHRRHEAHFTSSSGVAKA